MPFSVKISVREDPITGMNSCCREETLVVKPSLLEADVNIIKSSKEIACQLN